MYLIMLAPIYAHFFIYIQDTQLKVTKSTALNMGLVTFACCLA
jgi:hypothetical protein